jgi:predicted MFS family arabinose efflux permease
VFGAAPSLLIACAGIFIKAIGSNIYWTYSSVILQKSIPDQYLGRLMSLDLAGFQLATVISIVVTGAALEAWGGDQARALVFATAAASLAPLILWALTVRWIERRETVVSDSVIDPA